MNMNDLHKLSNKELETILAKIEMELRERNLDAEYQLFEQQMMMAIEGDEIDF